MKTSIKIEEALLFIFSIYLFNRTDYIWWWYLVLILTPDIGIMGYFGGPKFGAITYNILHHKAFGIALLCMGWYMGNNWMELFGIIMLGHSSLDRIFGYGLKYNDSFQHTHLGWLNRPGH